MTQHPQISTIAGHNVEILRSSQPEVPLIYWIMMAAHQDSIEDMAARITALTDKPFSLVACNVNNWDHELSPWSAPNITGQDDFTGEADQFLSWLLWDCMPFVEGWENPQDPFDPLVGSSQARSRTHRFVGGYSMAGLFALWALVESPAFDGAISGSGSLWYPHWLSWLQNHGKPRQSITYLSLGKQEPHTNNTVLAQVGEATIQTAQWFAYDSCGAHNFVWNPGNHFSDAADRMASGFAWVLEAAAHLSTES